ncbi:F-box-like/WD repeat-containing protein TBL1X [Rhopilema esculentum]|uniref:F-box-like/WD repeat-containing protein TBL1X n=1 Tax=Rhopilema esculentum TaxID=499914 RepID=UPI0031DFBEF0
MSILSDEVNFLVYRYLQESGYKHSAFTFGKESHVADSNINGNLVPPGALINIIQKGVQYIEAELCIHDDGTLIDDLENLEPIPLIDAVIPEALAARAANILQSAVQSSDPVKDLTIENIEAMDVDAHIENHLILNGHESEVFFCTWNCASRVLATGSSDGMARLWYVGDETDGKNVKSVQLDHQLSNLKSMTKDVTAMEWNPTGNSLASAAIDCIIRIWSLEGQQTITLVGHKGLIFAIKWNKKGSYISSASQDKRCLVWDTSSWELKQAFEHHQGPVLDIDWQNNTTFATCSTDTTVTVCRIGLDKPVKTFSGHTEEVNCVRWDPSGNLLASCSDDRTVKIWTLKQDNHIHDLTGHTREVTLVEWCPIHSTNILASASYDASIRLWNIEQDTCLHTLTRHLEPVDSISFSPDGKYLASATLDGILNIWSIQSGDFVHTHRSSSGLFQVKWSPDGTKLAVSQSDKQVKVLDALKLTGTS